MFNQNNVIYILKLNFKFIILIFHPIIIKLFHFFNIFLLLQKIKIKMEPIHLKLFHSIHMLSR